MGKNKLDKFAENETFANFLQPSREEVITKGFPWKGQWHSFFHNKLPLVLELGCGRGEYTLGMARLDNSNNYIGIDRKGARMWKGCKESVEEHLDRVAFLRMQIDAIEHYFGRDEVDQIWITFADPQPKKPNKRLTSLFFLNKYRQFLKADGCVNLKTDSNLLYESTLEVIEQNKLSLLENIEDVYQQATIDPLLNIKTYYEEMWLKQGSTIHFLKFRLF